MSMQRSFSEDHNTFVADPGGITPENTEDKVNVIVEHLMSDEELELGRKVEIIQHEKWSLTSLVKNHPTFLVRPINEEIMSKIGGKIND